MKTGAREQGCFLPLQVHEVGFYVEGPVLRFQEVWRFGTELGEFFDHTAALPHEQEIPRIRHAVFGDAFRRDFDDVGYRDFEHDVGDLPSRNEHVARHCQPEQLAELRLV